MTKKRTVQKKIFTAAPGSHIDDKKAAIYGAELEKLTEREGPVSAERLVEIAKSPRSVFHKEFQWDDTDAASKWRTHQARQLIGAIKVVITSGSETFSTRMFNVVGKPGSEGRGYVPIQRIAENRDMMDELLAAAKRDLEAWKAKYSALRKISEFGTVFKAIESIVDE